MAKPKSRAQVQEEQQDVLDNLQRDYNKTFSTDAGKNVLADLETIGFLRTTTHRNGVYTDTLVNEGSRRVLLHIQTMMKMDIARLRELRATIKKQRTR